MRLAVCGSRTLLLRRVGQVAFPVVAGVLIKRAFDAFSISGSSWAIWLQIVGALVLIVGAVFLGGDGANTLFQPNAKALAQMLLEDTWKKFIRRTTDAGTWSDNTHVRFVVYIPARWRSIGMSYMIPVHFLDSDPSRNSADFNIRVRTTQGWAGRTLREGKAYVADLDASSDLEGLGLTTDQVHQIRVGLKLRSKVCVPLRRATSVYGVFCIESCDPIGDTKFKDEQLLAEIVSLADPVMSICRTAYWLKSHTPGA